MIELNLTQPIQLANRGFIYVCGQDAAEFLQGQISNDIELLQSQAAIHALILTPQGKILADLFAYVYDDGYLLDVHISIKDWLMKRFQMFKLRSDVEFIDQTDQLQMVASQDPLAEAIFSAADPRFVTLGQDAPIRNLCGINSEFSTQDGDNYQIYMLSQALIEFGADYQASEHFPQDLWFDKLASVSFSKGCYVGQEVVSRMRHKSTARKRLLPLSSHIKSQKADKVMLDGKSVGEVVCQVGDIILAMMRIDKLNDTIIELDDFKIVRPEWIQNL